MPSLDHLTNPGERAVALLSAYIETGDPGVLWQEVYFTSRENATALVISFAAMLANTLNELGDATNTRTTTLLAKLLDEAKPDNPRG